jgi:hypothetical protein
MAPAAQDLPLERPALDYVLDAARADDAGVTLERGRQALGALGLSGSMALRKIGAPPAAPAAGRRSSAPLAHACRARGAPSAHPSRRPARSACARFCQPVALRRPGRAAALLAADARCAAGAARRAERRREGARGARGLRAGAQQPAAARRGEQPPGRGHDRHAHRRAAGARAACQSDMRCASVSRLAFHRAHIPARPSGVVALPPRPALVQVRDGGALACSGRPRRLTRGGASHAAARGAQEYSGALVAITHNPAFARSLEATHVLRVRDGRVELAANFGLTAADFDHTAPAVPVAAAGAAAAGAAAGKAASARKVRSKLRAVRCAPSALAPADAGRHSQAVMFSGRGLTAQAPDCCQEALPALRHGHRRRRACGRPPWR